MCPCNDGYIGLRASIRMAIEVMYIDVVPNRTSPPAILLRESYGDGNKVRKRTLLNLTSWPRDLVEGFRALLNGGSVIPAGQEALTIVRSLPHGPRRRGARQPAAHRSRSSARTRRQPMPRSRHRADREPDHRAHLQAGDRQSARPGHRRLQPG